MTDLEITRLCAEAMGSKWRERTSGQFKLPAEQRDRFLQIYEPNPDDWYRYDPLHDDAQAMALVKKFRLDIDGVGNWRIASHQGGTVWAQDDDLNRAICECVAKMQKAKEPA